MRLWLFRALKTTPREGLKELQQRKERTELYKDGVVDDRDHRVEKGSKLVAEEHAVNSFCAATPEGTAVRHNGYAPHGVPGGGILDHSARPAQCLPLKRGDLSRAIAYRVQDSPAPTNATVVRDPRGELVLDSEYQIFYQHSSM
jgi:hypothetical protein